MNFFQRSDVENIVRGNTSNFTVKFDVSSVTKRFFERFHQIIVLRLSDFPEAGDDNGTAVEVHVIFQVGAQRAGHVVREPPGQGLFDGLRLASVHTDIVQRLGITVRVDEDAHDVGLNLAVLGQVDG